MRCAHRWKIDSLSQDDVFHARCSRCGATRNFPRELDIDKPTGWGNGTQFFTRITRKDAPQPS